MVECCVPWLECSPKSFSCQTGAATQIQVWAQLEDLREGTHGALEALRVESNGGTETIEATLTLALIPKLKVSAHELQVGESKQTHFQLENQGNGTVLLTRNNRRVKTLGPGKSTRLTTNGNDVVEVRLDSGPSANGYWRRDPN